MEVRKPLLAAIACLLIAACGDGRNVGGSSAPGGGGTPPGSSNTFVILDSDVVEDPEYHEQEATLTAMFLAVEGDVIEFGEGTFDFTTSLTMSNRSGITVRGQGIEKTILNFEDSGAPEGITMSHMDGITIEELTVYQTPGFSVKISDSDHVVMRNVRTMWKSADNGMDPEKPETLNVQCQTNEISELESVGFYTNANGVQSQYVVDPGNGGYAIYPVLSSNILLENVIALGASDAGIYVGQSNDVIVRNSLAIFNVAGYEIENTNRADMHTNLAECNTAGFLIFDLPGLNQYGDQTRAFNNISRYNNTPNFAPGGIVSAVPQGTGFLQLGYDSVEIFGNIIENNRTVGFVNASHELLDGNINNPDKRMDLYGEGIHIHDNTFTMNGYSPQPPKDSAFICADGTGEGTAFPCVPTGVDDSDPSLLPALIQIKGAQTDDGFGPTGAHIVWDGFFDDAAYECELAAEFQPLVDENGKPQYTGESQPACRYNAYKFNPDGSRKNPKYWQCFHDNTFSAQNREYMNFDGTDPAVPPKTDSSVHDCEAVYGAVLAPLPEAVVEEYTPGAGGTTAYSEAEVRALCEGFSGSGVNRAALPVNCPQLSHYNLFSDSTDPRGGANDGGILFDLTTALFSDYAKKYRILFVPPGGKAQWFQGDETQPNQNIRFPVGTVIAKTFTFPDGAEENIVETRLLIHRQGNNDSTFWQGLGYIWETDADGNRTDATLAPSGGSAAVTWNYVDPDPEVAASYVGSTDNYAIPNPNQCTNCHQNDDYDPGSAPIGPKVRLLNRPMDYGNSIENQLQHWIDAGILDGAPTLTIENGIATNAARVPRWNVPNDVAILPGINSVHEAGSAEFDIEVRARAWMEVNCAHCHNRKGLARSTGVFFDTFKPVNLSYGVCKTPTTAGSSSGGNTYDIVPGDADSSIVSFRIHSENSGIQMPPIARSVMHTEAAAHIDTWITSVMNGTYPDASCAP